MPLGSRCWGWQGSPAPGGASRGGQGPPQPLRQPPAWTSLSHPASGSSLCQHNPLPSRGLFCSIGQLGAMGTDGTIPGYPSRRPPAADDLVSGKSAVFYRAVLMELRPGLSSHTPLACQKHAGVDGD